MSKRAWVLVDVGTGNAQQVQRAIGRLNGLDLGTCLVRVDKIKDSGSVYEIVVPVSATNATNFEKAINLIKAVSGVAAIRILEVTGHGWPDKPDDPCVISPQNAWG